MPLEPRGAVAVFDPATGRVTLSVSGQAPHLIRTGPASVAITTSPLISFDPAALQLAIGNATSLSVFNTAAGFLSQLTSTLNGSTAVFKLVAVGQYDAAANTFQASRINIALE